MMQVVKSQESLAPMATLPLTMTTPINSQGQITTTGYVTGINNRLLEDSKYRYEYDKVGNRTKRTDKSTNEVTEYSWDIRDRLTGIRVINALGVQGLLRLRGLCMAVIRILL